MRSILEAGLSGRWFAAGLEPPALPQGEHQAIASRAMREANHPPHEDPRRLAVRLNLRVHRLPVRDCGGELTDGMRIVYSPHPDPRETGLRVLHGIAHALLIREHVAHVEADVWVTTACLALPAIHAPEWFARAVLRARDALRAA